MIYTITLTPAIEKRVRGKMKDEITFEGEGFTYNCAGVGIKVSKYLSHYKIENTAAFVCGVNASPFILQELNHRGIKSIHMETNAKTPYHVLLIDEQENCRCMDEENQQVDDIQLQLFQSILIPQIQEKAVSILEYNLNHLSYKRMDEFYHSLYAKSEVMICDLHPDYFPILKEKPANVLVLNESQMLSYMQKDKYPLSEIMDVISQAFTPMAKIIVYTIAVNDFILFFEKERYRVVCSIKNPHAKIYKEALLCGILKCYMEDGDLNKLSKECITMSVATSISDGLFLPSDELIEEIVKSINVYRL